LALHSESLIAKENAMKSAPLVFMLACLALPSLVLAHPFDGRPKIVLHATAPTGKNPCTAGLLADCNGANTSAGLAPDNLYFVYVLLARGSLPDVDGFSLGIDYQNGLSGNVNDLTGLDIFSWHRCVALDFPSPNTPIWPAPGSGNLIIFSSGPGNCLTAAVGVGGYFYVGAYSGDLLEVTRRPGDNRSVVATCAIVETELTPQDMGIVAFSEGSVDPGCNPCLVPCPAEPIATEGRTWGSIKGLFGGR
jgi:hypothetical protein